MSSPPSSNSPPPVISLYTYFAKLSIDLIEIDPARSLKYAFLANIPDRMKESCADEYHFLLIYALLLLMHNNVEDALLD